MWVLKLKGLEKWNIYNTRTKEFGVTLYIHAHNYYTEKGKFFFKASGLIEGDKQAKKEFFADLAQEEKVEHLEKSEDYFVCIYSEDKETEKTRGVKAVYNPRLIFLKPVVVDAEGFEHYEVASIKRKDLERIVNLSLERNNVEMDIKYFKEKDISNIMVHSVFPDLTEKQKVALQLAVKHGYYSHPKSTSIKELAGIRGVSPSTFQFHLAKAEEKLMPYLTKEVEKFE